MNYEDKIVYISKQMNEYRKLWFYLTSSHTGRYSIDHMLQELERYIDDIERFLPTIREWATDYLEENRGRLWLQEGLYSFNNKELSKEELETKWPFLYKCSNREYKGFIVDREEAIREKKRQERRSNTINPTYVPIRDAWYCWFGDEDRNRWYKEDKEEQEQSRNIFFNTKLLDSCYEEMIPELDSIKEQWSSWKPRKSQKEMKMRIPHTEGKTRIQVVLDYISYDIGDMYLSFGKESSKISWRLFEGIWEFVESADRYIQQRRESFPIIKQILKEMEEKEEKERSEVSKQDSTD